MVLLSGRLLPGGDSSEAAASDGAYLYVTQVRSSVLGTSGFHEPT